jgi:predicted enzyme related to lactoylglutathione lyase
MPQTSRQYMLNLLVHQVKDIQHTAQFYAALGIQFQAEQHGVGPVHYSALLDNTVLEIYPANNAEAVTSHIHLGFKIQHLAETMNKLKSMNIQVTAEPKQTPWGFRAMLINHDGHVIELIEVI